jgi:hypothetical protein
VKETESVVVIGEADGGGAWKNTPIVEPSPVLPSDPSVAVGGNN